MRKVHFIVSTILYIMQLVFFLTEPNLQRNPCCVNKVRGRKTQHTVAPEVKNRLHAGQTAASRGVTHTGSLLRIPILSI